MSHCAHVLQFGHVISDCNPE